MKPVAAILIAAGLVAPVTAEANLELAKKSNCIACHQIDKKLVGPSYQDIAKKYAGNGGAQKTLVAKVKAGGKDVWGPVPMPPNPALKDADAATLVKWILAGAK